MVNKTLLPPRAHPGQTLKRLESLHFPTWHGIRSDAWRTAGLGEPSGSEHLQGRPGRAVRADRSEGRSTDAERASRRTFAADDAGAAAQRRGQQQRERHDVRLQGRAMAV